ncbi:MAG TPA: fibronectin type III-like domain-contianing protein, partial [Fimbriimonadaceae bacterium]|nr:fibronectin type III-like domain-contianing protein [Fimbriimonadaceae bacterium]
ETGNGLADVLFGDFNPSGRTTQTWVKSLEDLPSRLDYDLRKGRTYMYFEGEPLYPFGFGLSYTSYEYANLRLSSGSVSEGSPVKVDVDITNVGPHDGEEVVQLYVSYPGSNVYRPRKQLRGFERVEIGRGETRTVSFELEAVDLAYWSVDKQAWEVEMGRVEVQIGKSSAQIELRTNLEVVA